jgi:hypothetical protein
MDITKLKPGDVVRYFYKSRTSGIFDEGGGWATHEATGEVVQVNRVTVDVIPAGWRSTERVKAERIVEVVD